MNSQTALGWTDSQWQEFSTLVRDEVRRNSVAEAFLPKIAVSPTDKQIRRDQINAATRTLDDITMLTLAELSVDFILDQQQVQEPDLDRAKAVARRAAIDHARLQDAVLLRSQAAVNQLPA